MKKKLNLCITWLTQKSTHIFCAFQVVALLLTIVIYPSFESFLVFVVWLDLLILFYWLIFFNVPVLVVTIGLICVSKSVIMFQAAPMFATILFLFLLIGGLVARFLIERAILPFTFFKEFKTLEETIISKFNNDFQVLGALNLLTIWVFMLINFTYSFNPSFFVSYLGSFSGCFEPSMFLFSLLFIFSAVTEVLFCLSSSVSYPLLFSFCLIRVIKILYSFSFQVICFHHHCVGGDHDPFTSFKVVRQYQKDFFGAVANNSAEIKSLRVYSTFGQTTPPPLLEGTEVVDKTKLDTLNSLLFEKQEAETRAIKKTIEEASKSFIYDHNISRSENKKKFDELVSRPVK